MSSWHFIYLLSFITLSGLSQNFCLRQLTKQKCHRSHGKYLLTEWVCIGGMGLPGLSYPDEAQIHPQNAAELPWDQRIFQE